MHPVAVISLDIEDGRMRVSNQTESRVEVLEIVLRHCWRVNVLPHGITGAAMRQREIAPLRAAGSADAQPGHIVGREMLSGP